MASDSSNYDDYVDALSRQTDSFQQQFGCSMSPTFYFIHYEDGGAHWSSYQWGWDLRYLNLEKGDPTQCGKRIGRGIGICQNCYREKGDEIRKVCRKFEQELKENYQDAINMDIEKGKKIGIITFN
jgi:hypothetical protein